MRETLIIRDIGYWSHFVGDGSQPLHVSIHADGWNPRNNPQGLRTAKGFHAYFESQFITRYIKAVDVRPRVPAFHDCRCATAVRTIEYLRASHGEVVRLYQLEKSGAFAPTESGKSFAIQQLAKGSAELRDLIVTAWRDSASSENAESSEDNPDIQSGTLLRRARQ